VVVVVKTAALAALAALELERLLVLPQAANTPLPWGVAATAVIPGAHQTLMERKGQIPYLARLHLPAAVLARHNQTLEEAVGREAVDHKIKQGGLGILHLHRPRRAATVGLAQVVRHLPVAAEAVLLR
jgi:hypothetical protein